LQLRGFPRATKGKVAASRDREAAFECWTTQSVKLLRVIAVVTVKELNDLSMKKRSSKQAGDAERRPGHGTSNGHAKPPIKEFIESPNQSSRNGARIDKVVVHCTEAGLESTLEEFQSPGRQVSAHYVIDRNGDIYQMVRDSERANHCRGANESSIGIEHVGRDTDELTEAQTASSAALIRWLLEQYDIPPARVFGHDFTPGYNLPGGTSCPDRLFGPVHAQSTVAAWVARNVE
jgi:hypothetical protein